MRPRIIVLLLVFVLSFFTTCIAQTSQGEKAPKKPQSKPGPGLINLSKEYREAAMLARLAIENYQIISIGTRGAEYTQGINEAAKARTIAKVRATNAADTRVDAMISAFYDNALLQDKTFTLLQLSHKSYNESEEGKVLSDLMAQFHDCGRHLEKTLDAGKYTDSGPCKSPEDPWPERARRQLAAPRSQQPPPNN